MKPGDDLRFKCEHCGKLTTGRKPRGGDGSGRYPRKHRIDGKVCLGSFGPAEWVKTRKENGIIIEVKKAPFKLRA